MFRYLSTLCLAGAAIVVLMLSHMAYTYTFTTGYGLNPWLALVGIWVMAGYACLVIAFSRWMAKDEEAFKDLPSMYSCDEFAHLYTSVNQPR